MNGMAMATRAPGLPMTLLLFMAGAMPEALAEAPRDLVFECPCHAEWVADGEGGPGALTLTFGLRSHRAVRSGEVRLTFATSVTVSPTVGRSLSWNQQLPPGWPSLGRIPAGAVLANQSRGLAYDRPEADTPILVVLRELAAEQPAGAGETDWYRRWRQHEHLVLWPVSADSLPERLGFVDMLTDSDGDGVGDVNERLAGTSPQDASEKPGISTVDVLTLYDRQVLDSYEGYPFARMHHIMTLTNAIFADNRTNIRLRTVGMTEVEPNDNGLPENFEALMEPLGADLTLQFFSRGDLPLPCPSLAAGCATLAGSGGRGIWTRPRVAIVAGAGAGTAAHEFGHAMGLAHSARQGETGGAFRWSRGHYLFQGNGRTSRAGTIMTYGYKPPPGYVFSSPRTDCEGQPCGVPAVQPNGADALTTLELMRFQVAANREPLPDSDGDGFVDAADAAPDDPHDWMDIDGDGIGDNADPDDDNDGVADTDDAFPLNPDEWADADRDGVGDNLDDDVMDLSPFRDPALRAVVEEKLGKPPGAPITADDLAALTNLDGDNQSIEDLTGLELATGLEKLQLGNNEISDLSPLSNLAGLRTLWLGANAIGDLSPLSGLTELLDLYLYVNEIADLSPLSTMTGLRTLQLSYNAISDVSPLAQLSGLQSLVLDGNRIADVSPLSGLSGLWALYLTGTATADLSPLSELSGLGRLHLGSNGISDVSPLAGLSNLRYLNLLNNAIADISPLMGFDLRELRIGHNPVMFADVQALPYFLDLERLGLNGLDIADLSPLANLTRPASLYLRDNAISDISPLAGLTGLGWLDLETNRIQDIGALLNRSLWKGNPSAIEATLWLRSNPLNEAAQNDHMPTLESWGVNMYFDKLDDEPMSVAIPDQTLHTLLAQALARTSTFVDSPVTAASIGRLWTLNGYAAGISDLTGLEAAHALQYLFVGANHIADLAPLADLAELAGIDLGNNEVVDLSPLADNPGLGAGDWINLDGNPLSEESLNSHIPTLLKRGVEVRIYSLKLTVDAGGRSVDFDTSGYFTALLGEGIGMAAEVGNPALAAAAIVDGVLTVTSGAAGGIVTVTVSATDENGQTARLRFRVTVRGARHVALFPSASNLERQGFERLINRTERAGEMRIEVFDDGGLRHGPATLAVDAGQAVHFNSDDLEAGNTGKGLSGSTGPGTGDWRLELGSNLDLAVLSYIRTPDGFLTAMHDLAPNAEGSHRVAIFNPGGNQNQVSLLRLVNPGAESADISIAGIDDEGATPGGPVTLSLAAGAARTITARELEAGTGLDGALGDGKGKWRLTVTSGRPILVASLLRSPTGHLTNLSTAPVNTETLDGGETAHHVPLFLSAADPKGRQGFLRVINRDTVDAAVRIEAHDDLRADHDDLRADHGDSSADHGDSSADHGDTRADHGDTRADREPVTLTVSAGSVAHFNSNDLELGATDKGLSAGVGSGEGDWRLRLSSAADLEVLAYVRTEQGFLTSMHDVAPETAQGHRVPIFNPGGNRNQVSWLRIVNPGERDAQVTIHGIDDLGITRGGGVVLRVGAGRSRTISAQALEAGSDDSHGSLGDGTGKWRLTVTSAEPVMVMSLMESPTGHLTNLSTAPGF